MYNNYTPEGPKRDPNYGKYVTVESVKNVVATYFRKASRSAVSHEIRGTDLSKWNYPVDFVIHASKARFSYLRGGYGFYRDPNFIEYRREAQANNLPIGVYWYVYVGLDIDTQVNTFVSVLEEGGWVLPPCADFETTSLGVASTTTWIKTFMERLQAKIPKKAVIYTSPGWWNAHVSRNTWAKNYDLWVAHWTTADNPILPADWSTKLFWQYSADGNRLGEEYGSGGDADMDLNWFTGSLADWAKIIGVVNPPEPPPTEPTGDYQVTTQGLSIRTGPWTTYSWIAGRNSGEVITVKDFNLWVLDDKGWSAVRHLGTDYMKEL